jgi:ammonium transporter, Amt family
VHLVNGAWGALAVGIFANGNPLTAAWNGVDTPVTGLLYGGSTQILAQAAQVVSVGLFVFVLSFVFFKVLAAFKVLRSKAADELAGLDVPEMGAQGYSNDDVVMHGGLGSSRMRGSLTASRPPSAAPVTR